MYMYVCCERNNQHETIHPASKHVHNPVPIYVAIRRDYVDPTRIARYVIQPIIAYLVSQKKYDVADYQYFPE